MVARKFAGAAVAALVFATPANVGAALVTFKNQCEYPIEVYDNSGLCPLRPGSRSAPTYGCDREIASTAMYRHQTDPQATLAEFSIGEGKAWYDISTIPPGPKNCGSLTACKQLTGKTGFNVPIMILPTKYLDVGDYRCHRIMCHYEGCPDAFQFPADTDKVYSCPDSEHFQVIYCP